MISSHFIPKVKFAAVSSPITRLGVSFFPIYLSGNHLPAIETGDSSGLVVDEVECATVPKLSVHNPTKTPVLIVEGEHFLGGKQNRTVNVTVLVAAMSRLEIPVTCLERGRWGRERAYSRAHAFAPARVRVVNQRAVSRSMSRFGSRAGNQGQVWNAVDEVLFDLDARSATSAAADADAVYRRDERRREAVEELVRLGPLPGQCGIAVTHGRQVGAIELFGAPGLLAAHWPAVVRSHLLEPTKPSGDPSATAVLGVLKRLGSLASEDVAGVGLGIEHRVRDQHLVGQALTLKESLVHCSGLMQNGKQGARPEEVVRQPRPAVVT